MAGYNKFDYFVQALCNKEVDAFGTTDTWRAVISTDLPLSTDDDVTDLTQPSATNGYSAKDITFNSTRSTGTVTATAVDTVWTASGGNLGGATNTLRYVSYYDDTASTPLADVLAGWWDYGSTFTVADTETFTLDFGSSLWTLT